ncbi:hypothetical protein TVAG_090370 [Trichomonas vaginalis G3]|uniref:Glycosyltransferase 61 catalytic domain-containing protein n=1 Tax=Trichomonas vaginalis (strain ATCC PRA-98 / G3) TaxID=412133 RepID=A2F9Z4_TRIV3|nr:glycosyltransferase family [Trichomonas vaginalis G3]EAX98261.1 hypothetical protein TVAG_090370 [Trichomonas vaginalis G3]KAI5511187.1 glycosyltransferase family [Trichomonas vaginalis G3]|eukprot:XP_001311191.1 hypothetical protein [Trichomonas vaginalis G3]
MNYTDKVPFNHLVETRKIHEICNISTESLIISNLKLPSSFSHNPYGKIDKNSVIEYASHSDSTLYHLKNVYVCHSMLTSDSNQIFKFDKHYETSCIFCGGFGNVVGAYDHIIAVGNVFFQYGHFFIDVLAPLMLIPENIREKAYIAVQGIPKYKIDILVHIGFPRHRIVRAIGSEWLYGRNDYTLAPHPYLSYAGVTFERLGKLIRKSYKIEKIVPTKYTLSNRGKKEKDQFQTSI